MPSTPLPDVLPVTKQFLHLLYEGNHSNLYSYFHTDAEWISPSTPVYLRGIANVRHFLETDQKFLKPSIQRQVVFPLFQDTHSCMILADISGFFMASSPLAFHHVSTLLWVWQNRSWKLLSLHMSTPVHSIYNPVPYQVLPFHGFNGETVFLRSEEIIFIEADNMNLLIHTVRQLVPVRQTIHSILNTLPRSFVRIHRSYIVNTFFVSSVTRYCVTLTNQEQLPIPEKRYMQVRNALMMRNRDED